MKENTLQHITKIKQITLLIEKLFTDEYCIYSTSELASILNYDSYDMKKKFGDIHSINVLKISDIGISAEATLRLIMVLPEKKTSYIEVAKYIIASRIHEATKN